MSECGLQATDVRVNPRTGAFSACLTCNRCPRGPRTIEGTVKGVMAKYSDPVRVHATAESAIAIATAGLRCNGPRVERPRH